MGRGERVVLRWRENWNNWNLNVLKFAAYFETGYFCKVTFFTPAGRNINGWKMNNFHTWHKADVKKRTACGTNAHLSGAIILLKFSSVKMGHNSKSITVRVMPLSCNCTLWWWASIGVDTFNIFRVMGYIKVFAQ